MTTPHKALLIQARDALAYTTDPDSTHYEDQLAAIAALTAAIDSPEPKGLFIDLIAQHEGLAEELRDLPEPYDQQALEPCPVCGWKAIVPGEPCLMCERNARMLAPEPEPVAYEMHALKFANGKRLVYSLPEFLPSYVGVRNLYDPPLAVREPIHQALTDPENQPNQYGIEFGMRGSQMTFTIGSQSFTLAYEPDEPGEFEYMRDMLIKAFSIFTPDVKIAVSEPLTRQALKAVIASVPEPDDDHVGKWVVAVCRAVEAAHGIGVKP